MMNQESGLNVAMSSDREHVIEDKELAMRTNGNAIH